MKKKELERLTIETSKKIQDKKTWIEVRKTKKVQLEEEYDRMKQILDIVREQERENIREFERMLNSVEYNPYVEYGERYTNINDVHHTNQYWFEDEMEKMRRNFKDLY